MKLLGIAVIFLIGCSTPGKIILMSTLPREENWQSVFDEFDVRAIHRGVGVHTKWIDIQAGKISKVIRLDEARGVDYTNVTKRIWGVKFIKRFFGRFN